MLEVLAAGASHGMPTATANSKVVRALTGQGAGIRTLEHMPRAFTEEKEGVKATRCARSPCLAPPEFQRLFEEILRGPPDAIEEEQVPTQQLLPATQQAPRRSAEEGRGMKKVEAEGE